MNSSPIISLARTVPAAIVRSGIQRVFVNRLRRATGYVRHIVIVSPWITAGKERASPFSVLLKIIHSLRVPTYIITRRPQDAAHLAAIELLKGCPTVELVYNDNVHAKVYAACGPPPHGFAILGSANLTAGSLDNYEIGLLVVGVGAGSVIAEDLANFGIRHLRTRPESQVIKKMDFRKIRNAL